jgi:hypothetical protein
MRTLEEELRRLTDALAAGGNVPALLEAIRTREDRRRDIRRPAKRRTRTRAAAALDTIAGDLRTQLEDWKSLLERRGPEAKALLRLLVVDRLTVQPTASGYAFHGRGHSNRFSRGKSVQPHM